MAKFSVNDANPSLLLIQSDL